MTNKRSYRIRSTDKNKGLEPMVGRRFIIGYDPEIHGEDSFEFSYKLPVGAMKRLIRSYYKELEMVDQEGVYLSQSGSSGLRMYPYASRMIKDIGEQLAAHGLPGKKIRDEVFDKYFKKSYDKMKRYQANHPNQGVNDFERCADPECCRPLTRREKIADLLRFLYFIPKRLFWEFRWKLKNFKKSSSKKHETKDIPF